MSLIFYWFEYLSVLLERFVFPRKYLLQKLLNKISQELQTITSFQDLRMIMLRDVVQALRVYGGAVLVVHQDREPEIISEGEIEAQALLDWDGNSEDSKQLDYTRLEITRNEEYECYLFLTRKSSNTVLTMEEVRWLRIIVSYLSVSMENLFLTRKLRQRFQYMAAALPDQDEAQEVQWFRKLMIELQEDERYRIASDLHDTTMQDLFFLKRKVSNLFNEYTKHPEDQRKLESLLNYVEIINMNLRQSFFELHPMLIREVGLIQTMKKAFREDMVNQSFTVELKVDQEERIEEESLDVKRHLFRIVQELLSNAKKHSEARRVEFTLSVSPEGWLILKYKDDGVGMEQTTRRPENPLRSGIGLEQMKSRVIYMGGQFELHTSPGRGMRVVIEIPLQSQLTA